MGFMPHNHIENDEAFQLKNLMESMKLCHTTQLHDEAFQLKNLSSTSKRSVLSKKFQEQKDCRIYKFQNFLPEHKQVLHVKNENFKGKGL